MKELKPCPFCEGVHAVILTRDNIYREYYVKCNYCNARTISSQEKQTAIEAWNRRGRMKINGIEVKMPEDIEIDYSDEEPERKKSGKMMVDSAARITIKSYDDAYRGCDGILHIENKGCQIKFEDSVLPISITTELARRKLSEKDVDQALEIMKQQIMQMVATYE
jgi:Lar family restriction alleviation protein